MSTTLRQTLQRRKQEERAQAYIFMVRQNTARLKKRPRCLLSPEKCSNVLKTRYPEMEFLQIRKADLFIYWVE